MSITDNRRLKVFVLASKYTAKVMMFQNSNFFRYFVINFWSKIRFGKTFATIIFVSYLSTFYKT